MEITKIQTPREIETLAALASEIWHEFFPCILSPEQIDYMVNKFQSEHALTTQIKDGYQYYFLNDIGFCGFQVQGEKLFLSKLYIKKCARGNGFARIAFDFLKNFCTEQNLKSIYLTVNKYNKNTIAVYENFGFVKTDSVITDIGNNYIMDDYIFEYYL